MSWRARVSARLRERESDLPVHLGSYRTTRLWTFETWRYVRVRWGSAAKDVRKVQSLRNAQRPPADAGMSWRCSCITLFDSSRSRHTILVHAG